MRKREKKQLVFNFRTREHKRAGERSKRQKRIKTEKKGLSGKGLEH